MPMNWNIWGGNSASLIGQDDDDDDLLAIAAGATTSPTPDPTSPAPDPVIDEEDRTELQPITETASGMGDVPEPDPTVPTPTEPSGGPDATSPDPGGGPEDSPKELVTDDTEMYQQQQPAAVNESDAWTYEQTWIDPFIKQNLMHRDPVQLQSTMADIAAGQMSPVIQQQRERAMQSALATAASARGMPTSATQRMMTQQMSEADRSAMEAAAQQQLQAGQQVDQMAQADAQINAQLEQQRDSMLDSLIGRGVDRNVALAQVNSELDRLKEELAYKYWAGRLGSTTEILKQAVEDSDFLEGGVESVAELGPVINMLMGFGMPEGYGVPTTQIISDYSDDPQGIFTQTTTGGAPGMDEMIWNHETQSWEMQPGQPGVPQSLGVQDFAGQQVEVWRTWNPDKMIYEYSFSPPGYYDTPSGSSGGEWGGEGGSANEGAGGGGGGTSGGGAQPGSGGSGHPD